MNRTPPFRTGYGHFKYQIMLLGLSNALVSFYVYINRILVKKFNIFVIIYLDDILIYIKDLDQFYINVV